MVLQQNDLDNLLLDLYKQIRNTDFDKLKNGKRSLDRLIKNNCHWDIYGEHVNDTCKRDDINAENIKHENGDENDIMDEIDYKYTENGVKLLDYHIEQSLLRDILVGFYLPKICPNPITFQLLCDNHLISETTLRPGQFKYAIDDSIVIPINIQYHSHMCIHLVSKENASLSDIRLIYCVYNNQIRNDMQKTSYIFQTNLQQTDIITPTINNICGVAKFGVYSQTISRQWEIMDGHMKIIKFPGKKNSILINQEKNIMLMPIRED